MPESPRNSLRDEGSGVTRASFLMAEFSAEQVAGK